MLTGMPVPPIDVDLVVRAAWLYYEDGLTQAQVAARLFVSENTANWHRRNIYRKLGVHRRSEAVARGVELGLIAPGSQG